MELSPPNQERKLRDLIDLSTKLETTLKNDASNDETLDYYLTDVEGSLHVVNMWLSSSPCVGSSTLRKLDAQGQVLWNLCVRLRRDVKTEILGSKKNRLVLHVWLLGFQFLELGRQRVMEKDEAVETAYVLELVLTVTSASVNDSEFGVARLALQRGAAYVSKSEFAVHKQECSNTLVVRLLATYYTMRMLLSWREDRLDVTEHMFSKTDSFRRDLDVKSIENMADILQRVGADLVDKKEMELGLKWLRRAYDILDSYNSGLSEKARHLFVAVSNDIMSLIMQDTIHQNVEETRNILYHTEAKLGDDPILLHWQLKILDLASDNDSHNESYISILQRLVLLPKLSEGTFFLALSYIQKLGSKSSGLSEFVDGLLFRHAIPAKDMTWIGKMVFVRIWTTSGITDYGDECAQLWDVVGKVYTSAQATLWPGAVDACHAIIWKYIELHMAECRYDLVEFWCQLALVPLFRRDDETNVGRFSRRMIICGIKQNDMKTVYASLYNMPSSSSDDMILTHYLMFKVSLLTYDHELGCESIKGLARCKDTLQRQDLLYACFSEAETANNKACAVTALKGLAEQWSEEMPPWSNLPLILRCAIRLIHAPDNNQHEVTENCSMLQDAEDTCQIFEIGAKYAAQTKGDPVFPITELTWFRKNAYNLAVLKCHEWQQAYIIRIARACLVFIDCHPTTTTQEQTAELAINTLRNHFLITVCLLTQARQSTAIEQTIYFQEMRAHVAEYQRIVCTSITTDDTTHQDLVGKAGTLLVYDFEAAMSLSQFDDLQDIIQVAKPYKDVLAYKAMGNLLLQSPIPVEILEAALKAIINEIHTLEQFNAAKLSKYLRCIFQATIPINDTLAFQITTQVVQIAHESREGGTPLPQVELEWFVATTFNHAIDYYARSEEASCRKWVLQAMKLAGYVDDQGTLGNTLRERFDQLRFENDMISMLECE